VSCEALPPGLPRRSRMHQQFRDLVQISLVQSSLVQVNQVQVMPPLIAPTSFVAPESAQG